MLRPDRLSYPPQNHRDGAIESRKLDLFPTATINTFDSENWNTVVSRWKSAGVRGQKYFNITLVLQDE